MYTHDHIILVTLSLAPGTSSFSGCDHPRGNWAVFTPSHWNKHPRTSLGSSGMGGLGRSCPGSAESTRSCSPHSGSQLALPHLFCRLFPAKKVLTITPPQVLLIVWSGCVHSLSAPHFHELPNPCESMSFVGPEPGH